MKTIALIGNPNAGKTTLFNYLTGSKQKIGNWPGVTVACHHERITIEQDCYQIYDLPGLYSLNSMGEDYAMDEQLALQFIFNTPCDIVLNVIDVTHLERHLYLTLQLLELGLPVIIVLTRYDALQKKGITLDRDQLSKKLGCPIFTLSDTTPASLITIKNYIHAYQAQLKPSTALAYYPQTIQDLCQHIQTSFLSLHTQPWLQHCGLLLLEGQEQLAAHLSVTEKEQLIEYKAHIKNISGEDSDITIADTRYGFIHQHIAPLMQCHKKPLAQKQWHPDRVLLHRIWGIPCFFAVMYLLFFLVLNLGGAFQDAFDIIGQLLFINVPAYALHGLHSATLWIAFLAHGVGLGLNTLVSFIPILAMMFFLLAFLENCGYMARAAFVMDRCMRFLGLPGKSFIPFLVGFGCNVPAILAARTLENPRDRILTILMTPFMSCSARLAIYAVFAAAFFKTGGQNIVFSLYLIGILMAAFTGLVLRKCWLKGDPAPLIMELPPYVWPNFKELLSYTWQHLSGFIRRASLTIILACVILGGLDAITWNGTLSSHATNAAPSILASIGQMLTPLLGPIGIHTENWPATVALLTGIVAKEVVIATLNTLYSTVSALTVSIPDFFTTVQLAGSSILNNLADLPQTFLHPMSTFSSNEAIPHNVYGEMHKQFGSNAAAFSYLLFILLYYPCVATIAVIARELNMRLALFAMLWSLLLAYSSAVIFYQLSTWSAHSMYTLVWLFLCAITISAFVIVLRYFAPQLLGTNVGQQKFRNIEVPSCCD